MTEQAVVYKQAEAIIDFLREQLVDIVNDQGLERMIDDVAEFLSERDQGAGRHSPAALRMVVSAHLTHYLAGEPR